MNGMKFSAKSVEVTVVLDAAEFAATPMRETGAPRIILNICLPDRNITADINSNNLFHARMAILEAGSENIALVLQGRLVSGDLVVDGRLSALPKTPTPQSIQSHSAVVAATS
jgi:hypothetical protein